MKIAFIQKDVYEKVSIHYLAGALKANKYDYNLFIYDLEKEFYNTIVAYKPDVIIYSLFIGEEKFAFYALSKLKQRLPDVLTLVGGPFCLVFPEVFRNKEIDYLFKGDGEETLIEFLKKCEEGKDVSTVNGIHFINSEKNEIINSNHSLVDVTKIPFPDRDLYYKYEILKNSPTKIVIASRGCPYKCTYCYNFQLSKCFTEQFWRIRGIDEIIKEIKYLKSFYGVEWIYFPDGTFTANKKWLIEFLTEYSKQQLPGFLCNARVENLDEEIIRLLKQAGCDRITLGIQSGNEQIRRQYSGRIMSNEKISEITRLCKKYKIRVGVDIIFGWPSETINQAMDTIKLCREIKADSCSSNVMIYYPGIKITEMAFEQGFIKKLPTLEEISELNSNQSQIKSENINRLINFDKLFYYLIRFPFLEKFFLLLTKLPPNKIFYLSKNLHFLLRSFKYDKNQTKFNLTKNYFNTSLDSLKKQKNNYD